MGSQCTLLFSALVPRFQPFSLGQTADSGNDACAGVHAADQEAGGAVADMQTDNTA